MKNTNLYLLLIFFFTISLTSNVEAIPSKDIDIEITYYQTPSWVSNSGISFSIFESDTNNWATPNQWSGVTRLASGSGNLLPGITNYTVSVPIANLSNLYIQMWGGFSGAPPPDYWYRSIFVAEPPTGYVSDGTAWAYGPPWISLRNP